MDVNVDFCDAASWDDEMPARLKWLRENDPMRWSEESGVWLVSKFEHVEFVSKNPKLFCSGQGVRPNIPVRQGLIDEDDPRHTQLRSLINRGFTPRMVGKLETAFRTIIDETLDEVAPRGECDFVHDVAVPLPLLLIAEMIGIRREDREAFHRWSDAMMAGDGNYHRPEIMQKSAEAFVAYSAYVTELIRCATDPSDELELLAREVGVDEHVLVTPDHVDRSAKVVARMRDQALTRSVRALGHFFRVDEFCGAQRNTILELLVRLAQLVAHRGLGGSLPIRVDRDQDRREKNRQRQHE